MAIDVAYDQYEDYANKAGFLADFDEDDIKLFVEILTKALEGKGGYHERLRLALTEIKSQD